MEGAGVVCILFVLVASKEALFSWNCSLLKEAFTLSKQLVYIDEAL